MIVRESPNRARFGGDRNWPPRSPRDALLSSPSRQRRLQRTQVLDRAHSPSENTQHSAFSRPARSEERADVEEDDDEEDEETLQLQLQAIEARLKLKKLQKSKGRLQGSEQISPFGEPGRTSPRRKVSTYAARDAEIQVPLSPRKPPQLVSEPPESPKRVQLGIDKGLRASDVSLKKARPEVGRHRLGSRYPPADAVKPKSFNERLAEVRAKENERFEKHERARGNRSRGFELARPKTDEENHDVDIAGQANRSSDIPSTALRRQTQDTMVGSGSSGGQMHEPSDPDLEKYSTFAISRRILNDQTLDQAFEGKMLISIPKLLHDVTAPHYDPPDTDGDYVVFGIIASKSSPYKKAKTHLMTTTADEEDHEHSLVSKFMVLKLTDLKWEVDLFLFDTAFARFWKLTVGTVVAILNPSIMPPKVRDTGQFSLKLSSSEDTILELGTAKDIGWCKSIKKDGQECMQWIDGRKTEFCDFHVNMRISKARASRMEINGMVGVGIFGNGKDSASKSGGQGAGRWPARAGTWNGRDGARRNDAPYRTEGQRYAEAYVLPKALTSKFNTARLLDAEDYVQGGLNKAEQSRKRLAAKEKERELAQKLSTHGGGLGSEYLRLHHRRGGLSGGTNDGTTDSREPAPGVFPNKDGESFAEMASRDAASLGLLRGRGGGPVDLGPVEGRKGHGATRINSEPMGWSGAFKRGLPSPTRGHSPEKKKVKLKIPSTDGSDNHEDGSKQATNAVHSNHPLSLEARHDGRLAARKSALRKPHNDTHDDNDEDDDELDIIV